MGWEGKTIYKQGGILSGYLILSQALSHTFTLTADKTFMDGLLLQAILLFYDLNKGHIIPEARRYKNSRDCLGSLRTPKKAGVLKALRANQVILHPVEGRRLSLNICFPLPAFHWVRNDKLWV